MPGIFEYPHTVLAGEIDELGHANNVAYVAWLQSAAIAHSTAQGWPGERYREAGVGWVVRSHTIVYLLPSILGERIVVETWVATMQKVTSLRRYHVLRAANREILAKAETNWAFVNLATGRPSRIPRVIAEAFEVIDR